MMTLPFKPEYAVAFVLGLVGGLLFLQVSRAYPEDIVFCSPASVEAGCKVWTPPAPCGDRDE
jgi:hypothetical protein